MDGNSCFVSASQACKVLGVCHETLRRWSSDGKIRYVHAGRHTARRYDLTSVIKPAGQESREHGGRVDIVYARVSTRSQRRFLSNQSQRLVEQFGPDCVVVTDIGSGLNFKRAGLNKILERVVRDQVRNLYVSHKDRLCRFAFDLVEFVCARHGTTIIVAEDGDSKTPESELADDVLSIITVFGARLYGARGKRGKATRKRRDDGTEETAAGTASELQNPDVSDEAAGERIEDMVCSCAESV
jgi:putative resolvase